MISASDRIVQPLERNSPNDVGDFNAMALLGFKEFGAPAARIVPVSILKSVKLFSLCKACKMSTCTVSLVAGLLQTFKCSRKLSDTPLGHFRLSFRRIASAVK